MSRSGYSDDCSHLNLYRGTVERAIKGKRGQAMLRDMLAALDAMPVKELIADELVRADGSVCALGCVAKARGVSMDGISVYDADAIATKLLIASPLAREVAFENDGEGYWMTRHEEPQDRWTRMRKWVADQIKEPRP